MRWLGLDHTYWGVDGCGGLNASVFLRLSGSCSPEGNQCSGLRSCAGGHVVITPECIAMHFHSRTCGAKMRYCAKSDFDMPGMLVSDRTAGLLCGGTDCGKVFRVRFLCICSYNTRK